MILRSKVPDSNQTIPVGCEVERQVLDRLTQDSKGIGDRKPHLRDLFVLIAHA